MTEALSTTKFSVTDAERQVAQEANTLYQSLQDSKNGSIIQFLLTCECLKEMKKRKLWKMYAESWKTFLAGVQIEESEGRRMVRLSMIKGALESAGHTVDMGGIMPTRLTRIWLSRVDYDEKTNTVSNPEQAVELLDQCRELSFSDLKKVVDELIEKRGPVVTKLIEEGPVFVEGASVGYLQGIRATDTEHYLTIKIKNEALQRKKPISLEIK